MITSEESCNKAWGYESYNPGFPVLCTSFPDLDACQVRTYISEWARNMTKFL